MSPEVSCLLSHYINQGKRSNKNGDIDNDIWAQPFGTFSTQNYIISVTRKMPGM